MEKERKKRMEAEKANRSKNLVDMSVENQEGVLDGLMEALKTGSAFRDPSRPARKRKERKGMKWDLRRRLCIAGWIQFNPLE